MGVSVRPGRTAAKYSRTGMFLRRQVSTTERMAATLGPACWLPMWIQFFATERHRAHGIFGEIVAEFEFRVFQEEREFGPKRQRVVRGFGQGAGGQ